AVQFSPRLVLSHLRADNGCLRSGFYYRLPPGDVSSRVSAKAEFGPQLARLVVIGGATLVRRYRLRSGSAADALHPGAATNCTLVSGWLAHPYHPIRSDRCCHCAIHASGCVVAARDSGSG